jgi:hypothetical protein
MNHSQTSPRSQSGEGWDRGVRFVQTVAALVGAVAGLISAIGAFPWWE